VFGADVIMVESYRFLPGERYHFANSFGKSFLHVAISILES
jgi:hypothetical protein